MPRPLPYSSSADIAALKEIIRVGSHSFYAASRLLPSDVRRGAFALYAFCRLSDDTVDCTSAGTAGLKTLQRRLDLAYAGRPLDTVVDRCFAATIARHDIPKAYPAALLEGLGWDLAERPYRTLDDVLDYAARVAGTVGAMMTLLMDARSEAAIARATDLGAAMQLTNIARDVGEDARNGRLYLPTDCLKRDGLDIDAWRANPAPVPAIRKATERLLDEADRLYERGLTGLALLPARCRPAIRAAAAIYRDIGTSVAANGYDSVSTRAYVPGPRKLQLVAGAVPRALGPQTAYRGAPLSANAFLVSALSGPTGLGFSLPRDTQLGPGATMLDLLLKVEARERDRTREEFSLSDAIG